jgi:hypothetical protein
MQWNGQKILVEFPPPPIPRSVTVITGTIAIVTSATMPKQRLTVLDILALSTELQALVSHRLQNIYGTFAPLLNSPLPAFPL